MVLMMTHPRENISTLSLNWAGISNSSGGMKAGVPAGDSERTYVNNSKYHVYMMYTQTRQGMRTILINDLSLPFVTPPTLAEYSIIVNRKGVPTGC